MALTTENSFLLEYINKEHKSRKTRQEYYRIVYAFIIALVLNLFTTSKYDNSTILVFVYDLLTGKYSCIEKVLTALLLATVSLALVSGIIQSVHDYEDKIFFPDEKYKKMLSENKL